MRLREMDHTALLDAYKKACENTDPNGAEAHFRKEIRYEIEVRMKGKAMEPRRQDKE